MQPSAGMYCRLPGPARRLRRAAGLRAPPRGGPHAALQWRAFLLVAPQGDALFGFECGAVRASVSYGMKTARGGEAVAAFSAVQRLRFLPDKKAIQQWGRRGDGSAAAAPAAPAAILYATLATLATFWPRLPRLPCLLPRFLPFLMPHAGSEGFRCRPVPRLRGHPLPQGGA